jgi:hypothetical protein
VDVVGALRTVARGTAWLAIAVLIAVGGAGIVATLNPPPGTVARSELTWAGDAELRPALDAATDDLRALADRVEALSSTARVALQQVAAGDADALEATVTEGTLQLGAVEAGAAELESALAAMPYTDASWALHVSGELRRRYEQLAGTVRLTSGLAGDWAAFTGRSLAAARLGGLLTRHDEQTAAAARDGAAGRYREALDGLDASDATIALARELRDDLAPTTDVTTLTAWLDRNAEYDAALRELYEALIAADGEVTGAVRRAFDREQLARSQLPGDTRALVVIMADVAQGGLNEAVIAIETARGELAQALELQEQLRDGTEPAPPG